LQRLEVRAGIEPAYADLQSAASPLCHRTTGARSGRERPLNQSVNRPGSELAGSSGIIQVRRSVADMPDQSARQRRLSANLDDRQSDDAGEQKIFEAGRGATVDRQAKPDGNETDHGDLRLTTDRGTR
jgi:hypothetical protein